MNRFTCRLTSGQKQNEIKHKPKGNIHSFRRSGWTVILISQSFIKRLQAQIAVTALEWIIFFSFSYDAARVEATPAAPPHVSPSNKPSEKLSCSYCTLLPHTPTKSLSASLNFSAPPRSDRHTPRSSLPPSLSGSVQFISAASWKITPSDVCLPCRLKVKFHYRHPAPPLGRLFLLISIVFLLSVFTATAASKAFQASCVALVK